MNKYFNTDQQTLDDINVFGKPGGNSIHTLFNKTVTVAGSQLLEEMLRYPLCDADQINTRSNIIQHFASTKTKFPFKVELFSSVEQYLADTDERNRLKENNNEISTLFINLVGEQSTQKRIVTGITSTVEILLSLKSFVAEYQINTAWETERLAIENLLGRIELKPLLAEKDAKKIAYDNLVKYDTILRFRNKSLIESLLKSIYYLDVCIAAARVAIDKEFNFAIATSAQSLQLTIDGMRHPNLSSGVANEIKVDGESNVVFLTGANMAGKSTLMKTLGITLFLAHTGLPVPAKMMSFSVLDGIYTTINLPDNIGMGASHFYAEVLRVKKVVQALQQGKRLLVIFDELFRGTNVKDAYEATIATIKTFARKKDSLFVVSTHIIEAADELKPICPNVQFVYLPTKMNGSKPVYTYQLVQGVTDDRHGMVIINNEGILDTLRNKTLAKGNHIGFSADQQTLSDLNIVGRYKQDSIFSIFNKCLSRGGEHVLDQMFRVPLDDCKSINDRTMLLQYFAAKHLIFPFSGTLLLKVGDYIQNNSQGGRYVTAISILKNKIRAELLRDEHYAILVDSIIATAKVLSILKQFVQQLEVDGPFGKQLSRLQKLFSDVNIDELTGDCDKKSLSLQTVIKYQHLLANTCNDMLQHAMKTIYELDAYISVANVARENSFSYAKALPSIESKLQIKGMFHPGLKAQEAVANDLSFSRDTNTLFLTGANMAGKSTLMKSLGVAVYLAHMGFPIAAAQMEFSVLDGLYSSINVPDNLEQGYSHFFAEVMRVKTVAEDLSAGKNMMVLFDELFKGTNVKDAFDATLVCTEAFSSYHDSFFVVSTHIIEVGESLKGKTQNLQFSYMPTVMESNTPKYTYKLTAGITSDRHGMKIIENEGILDMIP